MRKNNKRHVLTWWHGLCFVAGLALATGLHMAFSSAKPHSSTPPPPTHSSQAAWGELEYTTFKLVRPDESFPEVFPEPESIRWQFQNFSPEQVQDLIQKTDLTLQQKQALLEQTRWSAVSNGWQILPPLEVVRDMNLSARKTLYHILGQFPQNLYLQNPFRIRADQFENWLADAKLSEPQQQLLRKLVIPEGDQVWFYDSLLMEWLCSPSEKRSLAKALSQTSTLLMKVRVSPQSDLDALMRYWGRGSPGKAMRPFLESLAHVPGGEAVNVSFFFPTFARIRLYTFPDTRNDRLSYHQDCFWTAMNFFNDTPDYSFFNPEQIQAKVRTDYTEVKTHLTFGDLIVLKNDNQAIHMCVYIADNVVFTKNGASQIAPWVLMPLPEMLKEFPTEKPLQMVVYRKKII